MARFIEVNLAGETYIINTSIIEQVWMKDKKTYLQFSTQNATGRAGMTIENTFNEIKRQLLSSPQDQAG